MSSHPSSLLRVPVEMPNRSGHNLSHTNVFSGTTGTLIPVFCEELLPNDTVSLGSTLQVQMPAMVTDFYGRVDFVLEAFFVPNRLCWGGWKDFITHPTANPIYPEGTPVQSKPLVVPKLHFTASQSGVYDVPVDSLLHYLDYGTSISYDFNGSNGVSDCTILPLIAYHRIWDDWYRDSRVQAPVFFNTGSFNYQPVAGLPFLSTSTDGSAIQILNSNSLGDLVRLDSLRQRNWVKDYFTSCSPLPQVGGASEVKFDVNSATETGAFTISTLRAANSLVLWRLS